MKRLAAIQKELGRGEMLELYIKEGADAELMKLLTGLSFLYIFPARMIKMMPSLPCMPVKAVRGNGLDTNALPDVLQIYRTQRVGV